MLKRREKDKFTYVGYSESGEMARIDICIGKIYSVSILLLFRNKKYIIPLSFRLLQKYELVKRINRTVETKQGESLNVMINKREYRSIRHFPISLSYDDNKNGNDCNILDNEIKYKIAIRLNDADSIIIFSINNLNELLSSLKEGMLFSGDRFIGLKVIELLGEKNGRSFWKAKCLSCGRITELKYNSVRTHKSCGCLTGKNFNSIKDHFLFYVDKQENVPKELQIRGTLGIDEEPCWLWTGAKSKTGYGHFQIKRSLSNAHRYSYKLHHDKDLPRNIYVCHRCDNPTCVNPNHLFEGTGMDNVRDMISKGRAVYLFGEDNPSTKLTEKEVLEIREKVKKRGDSIKTANEYKVGRGVISGIMRRKTWRHI